VASVAVFGGILEAEILQIKVNKTSSYLPKNKHSTLFIKVVHLKAFKQAELPMFES